MSPRVRQNAYPQYREEGQQPTPGHRSNASQQSFNYPGQSVHARAVESQERVFSQTQHLDDARQQQLDNFKVKVSAHAPSRTTTSFNRNHNLAHNHSKMSRISQDSQHFLPNMQNSYLTNNTMMEQSYANIGHQPSEERSPMLQPGNQTVKLLQSTANTSVHTGGRVNRQDSSDQHMQQPKQLDHSQKYQEYLRNPATPGSSSHNWHQASQQLSSRDDAMYRGQQYQKSQPNSATSLHPPSHQALPHNGRGAEAAESQ